MLQIGKWNWNVQANENGLLWILDSWFTTCSYKEIYVENYIVAISLIALFRDNTV